MRTFGWEGAPLDGVVQQGDYDDGQDGERRVAGGGIPPGDAAAQEDCVAQLVQALHLALELGHLRQRADALPCARACTHQGGERSLPGGLGRDPSAGGPFYRQLERLPCQSLASMSQRADALPCC